MIMAPKVKSISIEAPMSFALRPGETHQLVVHAFNSGGQDVTDKVTIVWTSSNNSVALVSSSGLVTGGATVGTANIKAAVGSVSSLPVVVTNIGVITSPPPVDNSPFSVSISPAPNANINIGVTAQFIAIVRNSVGDQLSGIPVTWNSSNPSNAAISASGLALGLTVGSTGIKAIVTGTIIQSATTALNVATTSLTIPLPALPTTVIDTTWTPALITGATHTPTDFTTLQAAFDTAVDGDCIIIPKGLRNFAGNILLTNRGTNGFVYVCTAEYAAGTFPLTKSDVRGTVFRNADGRIGVTTSEVYGQRVNITHTYERQETNSIFGQLQTDNNQPIIRCAAGAQGYWFLGIEFSRTATSTADVYALVNVQELNGTDAVTVAADMPKRFRFTHCIGHGEVGKNTRRFISCGKDIQVSDSAAYRIRYAGAESCAFAAYNGIDNFVFVNNYTEAGAQSYLFGGASPSFGGVTRGNIIVLNAHMDKDPTMGNYVQKNHFECKNFGSWVVSRAHHQHNRPVGQQGGNVLIQSLNDNNSSPPLIDIENGTYSDFTTEDGGPGFVLSGKAGYSLFGEPIVFPTNPSRLIHIRNGRLRFVCGSSAGSAGSSGHYLQIGTGLENTTIEHLGGEAFAAGIMFTGRETIAGVDTPSAKNLRIKGCLFGKGLFASFADATGQYSNGMDVVAHNVDGIADITENVFYGNTHPFNDATVSPPDDPGNNPAGNHYVNLEDVGFENYHWQNPGKLAATSQFKNACSDGKDMGPDHDYLDTVEASVKETHLPY